MNIIKKYISFFLQILILTLLIVFRSVPSGHLWDGYTILYVPAEINEEIVTNIFDSTGISEYVSLNKQRVPILLAANSVEAAMLKLNISTSSSDYLNSRENFFFDSTGQYKLFYIPNSYENKINDAVRLLEKNMIKTGLDTSYSYPWLLPVIILLLTIMFTCFTKNKLIFILECIFPVVYVFCNPFFASNVAVVLLMVALFFISNLWGRKNAIKHLSKGIVIGFIFIYAVTAAFSSSILSGIFFVLALTGIYLILLSYKTWNEIYLKKQSFVPVFIKPAKMISVFGGNGKIVMPVSIGCVILILVYFAFTSKVTVATSSKKIMLPGKAAVQAEKLPSLEDFYKWNWNVTTAPYKSLNSYNPSENEYVAYPKYSMENGVITESEAIIYYNDAFKQNIYNEIDKFDFNSIEQVLKNQEIDFKCDYVTTGTQKNSLFSIIMMFICLAMLLFIYFSVMIKKGGRK